MNFIAHYYLLNHKENNQIAFGNVWPDFQRGFSKLYNSDLKNNSFFLASQIAIGVNYHLQTDDFFHKHLIFIKTCRTLENIVKQHNLTHEKMHFSMHILFELLIDYYLLNTENELENSFYDNFNHASIYDLESELAKFLGNIENDKIIRNFKGFIKNRYATYLLTFDGVIQTLNALIGKRIGVHFDAIKWQACINDCFIAVETDIKAVLIATKNELLKHD